jgi:hypothetical protein
VSGPVRRPKIPHAPPVASTTRSAVTRAPPSTADADSRAPSRALDRDGARVDAHDAGVPLDGFLEEPVAARGRSGPPPGVVHAARGNAPLQRRVALIEAHAHRAKLRDRCPGASRTSTADRGRIAEARPRGDRVGGMLLGRVVGRPRPRPTPPWAQAVAVSSAAPGAITVTTPRVRPRATAHHRPAAPAPITTVRALNR